MRPSPSVIIPRRPKRSAREPAIKADKVMGEKASDKKQSTSPSTRFWDGFEEEMPPSIAEFLAKTFKR
jgi:hypothetical protein